MRLARLWLRLWLIFAWLALAYVLVLALNLQIEVEEDGRETPRRKIAPTLTSEQRTRCEHKVQLLN